MIVREYKKKKRGKLEKKGSMNGCKNTKVIVLYTFHTQGKVISQFFYV